MMVTLRYEELRSVEYTQDNGNDLQLTWLVGTFDGVAYNIG